jgi:hypothetical protein
LNFVARPHTGSTKLTWNLPKQEEPKTRLTPGCDVLKMMSTNRLSCGIFSLPNGRESPPELQEVVPAKCWMKSYVYHRILIRVKFPL